jgi:hypothetical protein
MNVTPLSERNSLTFELNIQPGRLKTVILLSVIQCSFHPAFYVSIIVLFFHCTYEIIVISISNPSAGKSIKSRYGMSMPKPIILKALTRIGVKQQTATTTVPTRAVINVFFALFKITHRYITESGLM